MIKLCGFQITYEQEVQVKTCFYLDLGLNHANCVGSTPQMSTHWLGWGLGGTYTDLFVDFMLFSARTNQICQLTDAHISLGMGHPSTPIH